MDQHQHGFVSFKSLLIALGAVDARVAPQAQAQQAASTDAAEAKADGQDATVQPLGSK